MADFAVAPCTYPDTRIIHHTCMGLESRGSMSKWQESSEASNELSTSLSSEVGSSCATKTIHRQPIDHVITSTNTQQPTTPPDSARATNRLSRANGELKLRPKWDIQIGAGGQVRRKDNSVKRSWVSTTLLARDDRHYVITYVSLLLYHANASTTCSLSASQHAAWRLHPRRED